MQRKKGKSKKTKVVIEELPAPPVESASVKKTVKRKRAANPNQVEQEGWPVTPRTLMQLPEGFVLSRSAMKTVVREVAASEYASPFMDPVDPDEAPGYTDLVETPMDLGRQHIFFTNSVFAHLVCFWKQWIGWNATHWSLIIVVAFALVSRHHEETHHERDVRPRRCPVCR